MPSTEALRETFFSDAEAALAPAKKHWGLVLALGVLMIILGTVGFFHPVVYTIATVIVFGAMLLVGGGAGLVTAFRLEGWKGKTGAALFALLYVVTGALLLLHPLLGALSLTLVVGAFLAAAGAIKLWLGFTHREQKGWWLVVLSGLLSVLLGILIFGGFPGTGLWILGLFIAIELIFDGWAAIGFALAARDVREPGAAPAK